ncbi:unnamed protein product, partial [Polarella glacialis]
CSERLRSVIVVMRHGDRRPKEKMKFKCKQPSVLSYFDKVDEGVSEVKLKTAEELETLSAQMVSAVKVLGEQVLSLESAPLDACSIEENNKHDERLASLKQELLNMELLIPVLEMKDRFSGLERKVQLKAVKWKQASEDSARKPVQVQIVAKWGGELTVSGLAQAEELGRRLRHDLYPDDPAGLLRLHSSFRHDFKIYSSQEGRCQITAASFTKGFLELEGDIIPILVSLVTRDTYAQGLLDEPIPKKIRDAVKQRIESLLMSYDEMSSARIIKESCPTPHSGLREAAKRIGSPLQLLHTIKYLAWEYIESISAAKDRTWEQMRSHATISPQDLHDDAHEDAVPLSDLSRQGVPDPMIPFDLKDSFKRKWLHLRRKEHRWRKLFKGFVRLQDEEKGFHDDDNVSFDPSKIPDVWDNLYYDMLTHRNYLGKESCRLAEMMVGLIHPLSEWVCLSEYGISEEEKLRIGVDVTWRLIGKMLGDLEFMIQDDVGSVDEAGRLMGEGAGSLSRGSGIPRRLSGISGGIQRTMSGIGSATSSRRQLAVHEEDFESPMDQSPFRHGAEASSSSKAMPAAVSPSSGDGADAVRKEAGRKTGTVTSTSLTPAKGITRGVAPSATVAAAMAVARTVSAEFAKGGGGREWREWSSNPSAPSGSRPHSHSPADSVSPMGAEELE